MDKCTACNIALAIAGGEEYSLNFLFAISLQFQLDVNNLAFVHIFIISNSIRLRAGQTIFKCPAIANALPLQAKRRDERTLKIITKIKIVFVLFFFNAHLAHLVFANAQTNHKKPKELNFRFATNSQTQRLFYRIKFKIKSGFYKFFPFI